MLMKTEIIIVRGQSRLTDGIFSCFLFFPYTTLFRSTEIIIVRGQSRLTDGIFSNLSKQKQLWVGYQVSNKLQVAVRSSRRSLNAKLSVKVIYGH